MHANLAVFGPSPHRALRNAKYLCSLRNLKVDAQLVHLTRVIAGELGQTHESIKLYSGRELSLRTLQQELFLSFGSP